MIAQVTFKSGAQVEFQVTEIACYKHPITGIMNRVTWEPSNGAVRRVLFLDVDNIEAIITIEESKNEVPQGS